MGRNLLLGKVAGIEERYNEINLLLEQVGSDYQKATELSKERSELASIVDTAKEYKQVLKQLEETRPLLDADDKDLVELAKTEISELDTDREKLESRIKTLLLPSDPRDERNVIVEIRAGTGGDEAGIFASDLYRMYARYAERQGWTVEILSMNETGVGGFKEVVFLIKGKRAYSKIKYDSGVHRVQRVPVTESQGRIHTSTATVAVLAEVDDVEIDIPERDIKMDVYKSAGAGGQNVQKNSTAVRITHLPTGIVAQCQDERSQLQNRIRAMSILRARLYDLEADKRQLEIDADRKAQVGSGERAEKIRTYNYPQSRLTDHRINLTVYNLPAVLDGDLDVFFDELAMKDEAARLAAAGLN